MRVAGKSTASQKPKTSRIDNTEAAPKPKIKLGGRPTPESMKLERKHERLDNANTRVKRKIGKLEDKSFEYKKRKSLSDAKKPQETKLKAERVFNDDKGKPEIKLRLEKTPLPIGEAKWNKKPSLPKKIGGEILKAPVKVPFKVATAAASVGWTKVHRKVSEAENERGNEGVKVVHKAELMAESGVRAAAGKFNPKAVYRYVKNTPYRKSAKAEVKALKADKKAEISNVKLEHGKEKARDVSTALTKTKFGVSASKTAAKPRVSSAPRPANPKLKSTPLSRFMQKRRIKRQYAAAIRKAKKSGQAARASVGIVAKGVRLVTSVLRGNPIAIVKLGVLGLLILLIVTLVQSCVSLAGGGGAIVGGGAYSAETEDIQLAAIAYSEWEVDIHDEALNAESSHPGYDEYRYDIFVAGHEPNMLIAYLTAMYQDFSFDEIMDALREVFDEQYQLTFEPEVEIRTRTETDEDGNDVEVEYEWHILNVTLSSVPFLDVILPRMGIEQGEHFGVLTESGGLRYLVHSPFAFDWSGNVSSHYGWRKDPFTGAKDFHTGIDIAPPLGTPVLATHDGDVTTVIYSSTGYGNYIVITGKNGLSTLYAHLDSISVTAGEIRRGDVIGTVGSSGYSTGPHLHFEVLMNGGTLNPAIFTVPKP